MRIFLSLALIAMFLQIAVFLQPLFPEKFQISLVCETIVQLNHTAALSHHTISHLISLHDHSPRHDHLDLVKTVHSHNADHQCIYCKVYGYLVAHLDLSIKEVFQRLQIRLVAFQQAFSHVFFSLKRLFLSPQGRAPPLFV